MKHLIWLDHALSVGECFVHLLRHNGVLSEKGYEKENAGGEGASTNDLSSLRFITKVGETTCLKRRKDN